MLEKAKFNIKTQRWVLIASVIILVGKFIAYLITNSAGVLTDALESVVNVVAGAVTLISLAYALKPIDADHPFGHGKAELVSASLEGLLILFAGILIMIEGVGRLFHPAELRQLDIGIWIVAGAGIVNYLLGAYCITIGKRNSSIALVAEGKHLQSDTYSSIGLVVGLVLVYLTDLVWLDSALALVYGIIILATGVNILRKTVSNLMDRTDEHTVSKMTDVINEQMSRPQWVDVHNLRAVVSGHNLHVDLDITLPYYMTVEDAHKESDLLQQAINEQFEENILFSIHFDPCKPHQCCGCSLMECTKRSMPFEVRHKLTTAAITAKDLI